MSVALGSTVPATLPAFRAALANRDNANVRIAVVGDSWSSGWNVTTESKTWINRWQDKLRAAYPTTSLGSGGGLGYRPFRKQQPAAPYTNPWTLTGTSDVLYFGLGLNGAQFSSGHKAVMTVVGTSADLHFTKGTAAAQGYYKVDGGTAVNFNTGGFASQTEDGIQTIPLGASGSHTLEVGWASGAGGCFMHGCVIYNGDETKGITCYSGGHASYTTTQFVPPASGVTSHNQRVGSLNPHLTVIMLGVNDAVGGSKLTPAQYATNLQTMINNFRTAGVTGSFLILSQGDVVTSGMSAGNNPLAPWASYCAAAAGVAAADPVNVGYFNLSAPGRIPASPSTSGGGIWVDNLHLGDDGHELMADLAMLAIA